MSLRNNELTAFLAKKFFDLRTRGLEKLIFTATTGRSGTLTLKTVFSAIPHCIALHEPYPVMNDDVLEAACFGNTRYVDLMYRQRKSVVIRRSAVGYRYYLESNHLFIKTFARQVAEDFGDRVRVIHLVRAPLEVAMSMYHLNHFPGSAIGNRFCLYYRAPSNHIQIAHFLDTEEFSHPFYKALWYWFEIEERILQCRERLPTLRFVKFRTEWLNDSERICELLDQLEIQYDRSAIKAVTGTREHTLDKYKHVAPLARSDAERMMELFLESLRKRGIALPEVEPVQA